MANPPSNNPSTPLNTRAEALIQGRGMNHQRRDVRRGGGRHRNRDDGIDARGRQGQEDVPNDERRRHRPGNRGTHHLRQADNNAPLGHQFAPNRANGNAGSTTVNATASNKRITRVANRRAPINTTSDIADSNRTIGEEETKDDSPMHTRSGLPFQMRDNRGGDASRRDNNRRHHQTNSRVASSTHLPSAQEREYTMASNMAAAMIRSEIDRTSNQPSSGSTMQRHLLLSSTVMRHTTMTRQTTYNINLPGSLLTEGTLHRVEDDKVKAVEMTQDVSNKSRFVKAMPRPLLLNAVVELHASTSTSLVSMENKEVSTREAVQVTLWCP